MRWLQGYLTARPRPRRRAGSTAGRRQVHEGAVLYCSAGAHARPRSWRWPADQMAVASRPDAGRAGGEVGCPRRVRSYHGTGSGRTRARRPVRVDRRRLAPVPCQYSFIAVDLRRRKTCQQRHPPGQAGEDQVEHSQAHKPAMLPAGPPTQQANPQISNLCPVLEPHRSSTASRTSTRSPLDNRALLRKVAGHSHIRVFEPNRPPLTQRQAPGQRP